MGDTGAQNLCRHVNLTGLVLLVAAMARVVGTECQDLPASGVQALGGAGH